MKTYLFKTTLIKGIEYLNANNIDIDDIEDILIDVIDNHNINAETIEEALEKHIKHLYEEEYINVNNKDLKNKIPIYKNKYDYIEKIKNSNSVQVGYLVKTKDHIELWIEVKELVNPFN